MQDCRRFRLFMIVREAEKNFYRPVQPLLLQPRFGIAQGFFVFILFLVYRKILISIKGRKLDFFFFEWINLITILELGHVLSSTIIFHWIKTETKYAQQNLTLSPNNRTINRDLKSFSVDARETILTLLLIKTKFKSFDSKKKKTFLCIRSQKNKSTEWLRPTRRSEEIIILIHFLSSQCVFHAEKDRLWNQTGFEYVNYSFL